MTKYVLKRLIRGLLSVIVVVAIVMLLIYSCLDRDKIFQSDGVYSKQKSNSLIVYKYQKWEEYGYLDFVTYADFLKDKMYNDEIDQATYDKVVKFGQTPAKDSPEVAEYVKEFTEYYENKGYDVERLDVDKIGRRVKPGGKQQLFAHKDIPLIKRLGKYFTGLIKIDNIHYVKGDIEDRGLKFTWFDPVYGGEKFSPAIMGNGTEHKYLLYFDSQFPFVKQNLINIHLGKSYSVNRGIDVYNTMVDSQGAFKMSQVIYPSGNIEESADDLHSARYLEGSLAQGTVVTKNNFVDDYTMVNTAKSGMSRMGYSFTIGIISVIMSYLLAIPLGLTMARRKGKFLDKIGTLYIVFIIAVPSLAYIFLFKSIGGAIGLPTVFDMQKPSWQMYILPIVSLALPSVANLMKWLRRYMIDQMNSDYVKFARSGGLSENEIFRKHILKNAIIPIVHGIPGSVLGAIVGAIITESVYVVPGTGNLLTRAINNYDNGVIVGVTLFYALLSVISVILGDVFMALVDPRISYTSKAR